MTNMEIRENCGKWHIDHIEPCASFDLKCPLCGFIRSIYSLLSLDFYNFFFYNMLSLFYIAIFLLFFLKFKKQFNFKIIILVMSIFFVVRNLDCYPFY